MAVMCSQCRTASSLSYNGRCKSCYNSYMAEYMLARYHRRRVELIELLGGCCVQCNSTLNLEFDHIDRKKKASDISKILAAASESVYRAEIAKCQLLCGECHKAKTSMERSVPHGGGLTGKKRCYCELCAPLKRAYNAEFMRRSRASKNNQ